MFAHGDDDLREPVYDLTLPPVMAVEYSNPVAGVDSEQTYHLDPQWSGKFLNCYVNFYFTYFDGY